MSFRAAAILLSFAALACGDSATDPGPRFFSGEPPAGPWFDEGGDGVADARGAGATVALAGRATADMLPDFDTGLQVWEAGDFILANDHVALVIEDVGPSDLYDPWGGRPVGMARIEGGELVEPADFGEVFLLFGTQTVVTEFVGVVNDGTNGEPAVIRAQGRGAGIPFLDEIAGRLFRSDFANVPTAIDYVLAPGVEYVDVWITHHNYNDFSFPTGGLRGFMYGERMPAFTLGDGFESESGSGLFVFADEDATSWAYAAPGETMQYILSTSGFVGASSSSVQVEANTETRTHYARIYIGGRGIDGALAAYAHSEGITTRTISGVVYDVDGSTPAAGVRVHATRGDAGELLTRTLSGADGRYALTVPADADVSLRAYRQGDSVVGPVGIGVSSTDQDFTLAPAGYIRVEVTESVAGAPSIPARVDIYPAGASSVPTLDGRFGERTPSRVLHEAYASGATEPLGQVTLRAPVGDWEVVVSHGPEFGVHRQQVTVSATDTAASPLLVPVSLTHEVESDGVMCADFHVHSTRSNDGRAPIATLVQRAAADALDIQARSEHEFVEPLDPLVVSMGLGAHVFGLASLELTTAVYGHFGVIPVEVGPGVNGGTPQWMTYPSAADPTVAVDLVAPSAVFADTRGRPEAPALIINHPRGPRDYFDYVGLDQLTGTVTNADAWDQDFTLIEVFNSSGWLRRRDGLVQDWFTMLNSGRPAFAVGSSDTHRLDLGYPRTCLAVGTDDPRALTPALVRDAARDGHSVVSGGVYIDVNHPAGGEGPGETATGVGAMTSLDVRVQAASWIDGDLVMDVIVDGVVSETIDLTEGAVERFSGAVNVSVAAGMAGSWVVLAVYSPTDDADLDPVHPGADAFGVSNPIWLVR